MVGGWVPDPAKVEMFMAGDKHDPITGVPARPHRRIVSIGHQLVQAWARFAARIQPVLVLDYGRESPAPRYEPRHRRSR
jgi:hypothetical protein